VGPDVSIIDYNYNVMELFADIIELIQFMVVVIKILADIDTVMVIIILVVVLGTIGIINGFRRWLATVLASDFFLYLENSIWM
jgi:hypothetical protein